MLGKSVFVFDEEWNVIFTYPDPVRREGVATISRISDARIGDFDDNGEIELWIAFADDAGLKQVEISSGTVRDVLHGPVKSIAAAGKTMLVVLGNDVVRPGSDVAVSDALRFKRVLADSTGHCFCAVGLERDDRWRAQGFNELLLPTWSAAIPSQYFENEIEPLVTTRSTSGNCYWGIAGPDGTIRIMDGDGTAVGDVKLTPMNGMAIFPTNDFVALVVSRGKAVECFALNPTENRVRQISTRR
jgi:hypothetical protein